MNQKNILIIIGVIILIALIVWGIAASNNNDADVTTEVETTATVSPSTTTATSAPSATATAAPTAEAANLTVTYNGTSFSPSTLTIQKGQTVTFTNNSNGGMWVASDPHPVHTDFSAFDARKSYANGTSYTFTFDKAGTYHYHNHLNDDATGTIVVQ